MYSKTVIYLKWKLSGRLEIFTNLGKLYSNYDQEQIGVSRSTLDRKDLFTGYQNDTVEIQKIKIV